MRTFAIPALLLLIATAIACQDTPQPLDVDSVAPRAQLMSTVVGNIANDGPNYVGRIIIIKGGLGGRGASSERQP